MGGHNPNLGKDIGLGVATAGVYPAFDSMYHHNKNHVGGEGAFFGLGPAALLLPQKQQQQQPAEMNAQNLAMLQQMQNPNQNFNGVTF